MYMKVCVITRHAISNYGSFLQTLATQLLLEKLGCSCEIIDYIREDEDYRNIVGVLIEKNLQWKSNPVKRIIYKMIQSTEYKNGPFTQICKIL